MYAHTYKQTYIYIYIYIVGGLGESWSPALVARPVIHSEMGKGGLGIEG